MACASITSDTSDKATITVEEVPSSPEAVRTKDATMTFDPDLKRLRSGLQDRVMQFHRFHQLRSPLLMSILFITGFAVSLAHCIFYSRLSGRLVGSAAKQESNIRFGTVFAFISQISFAASVWLSYTQWLWKSVRTTEYSVRCLNAAFCADSSVFSLMNLEMIRKFKVGTAMAFLAWSLILPSFFTPATLSIYVDTKMIEIDQTVASLAITDSSIGGRFAFSPPMRSDQANFLDDGKKVFTGPRSILSLISSATASLGEILPIKAPYNHSTYSIQFYGPVVHCDAANTSVASLIATELRKKMSEPLFTAKAMDNVYYGFVPGLDSSGELIANSRPRLQSPSNATNELWITFSKYVLTTDGSRIRERRYQICALHNASYDLQLEWIGGAQKVQGSYRPFEKVPFPHDRGDSMSNMSQHAYSAMFWALTDQLVGQLTWFNETDIWKQYLSPEFGVIDSPIRHTSLLGSSDLDVFFDLNKNNSWYGYERHKTPELSDQRRQDKNLAKNRTLDVLIEELSYNLTVSLLHNELLTHNKTAKVIRWDRVNRYRYNAPGLFIPYALANIFTLLTIILGAMSYCRHGVLPGKTIEDIVLAMADPEIADIIKGGNRNGSVVLDNIQGRPIFGGGVTQLGRVV